MTEQEYTSLVSAVDKVRALLREREQIAAYSKELEFDDAIVAIGRSNFSYLPADIRAGRLLVPIAKAVKFVLDAAVDEINQEIASIQVPKIEEPKP